MTSHGGPALPAIDEEELSTQRFLAAMKRHACFENPLTPSFRWSIIAAEMGLESGLEAAKFWLRLMHVDLEPRFEAWEKQRNNGGR